MISGLNGATPNITEHLRNHLKTHVKKQNHFGNQMTKELVFAVLIDGENVGSSLLGQIVNEVERLGVAAVRKVYGDWTQPSMTPWKDALQNYSFRPEQQFHYGKDAADHALIMDAIELISTNKRINAICVVSSDGGFYSLAQRIRERGLYMMGIGRRNTPDRLIKACLNFVYVDNLETTEPVYESIIEEASIESLLLRAYTDCAALSEPVNLGAYGKRLKSINSAFDPRTYGHATLKKMVKSHSELFFIDNETIDQCFIRAKNKTAIPERIQGTVKRWLGNYGFIESNGDSWHFYISNIREGQRDTKIKPGLPVSFISVKQPNLDGTDNIERNGKADDVFISTDC